MSIELKTLFGYPVTIVDLMVDDILCFVGNEWINVGVNEPKPFNGFVDPDTTGNMDTATFTMDGIPTISNNFMRSCTPLMLVLEEYETRSSETNVEYALRVVPHPCSSLHRGSTPMPLSYFYHSIEPNTLMVTSPIPVSDFLNI